MLSLVLSTPPTAVMNTILSSVSNDSPVPSKTELEDPPLPSNIEREDPPVPLTEDCPVPSQPPQTEEEDMIPVPPPRTKRKKRLINKPPSMENLLVEVIIFCLPLNHVHYVCACVCIE